MYVNCFFVFLVFVFVFVLFCFVLFLFFFSFLFVCFVLFFVFVLFCFVFVLFFFFFSFLLVCLFCFCFLFLFLFCFVLFCFCFCFFLELKHVMWRILFLCLKFVQMFTHLLWSWSSTKCLSMLDNLCINLSFIVGFGRKVFQCNISFLVWWSFKETPSMFNNWYIHRCVWGSVVHLTKLTYNLSLDVLEEWMTCHCIEQSDSLFDLQKFVKIDKLIEILRFEMTS